MEQNSRDLSSQFSLLDQLCVKINGLKEGQDLCTSLHKRLARVHEPEIARSQLHAVIHDFEDTVTEHANSNFLDRVLNADKFVEKVKIYNERLDTIITRLSVNRAVLLAEWHHQFQQDADNMASRFTTMDKLHEQDEAWDTVERKSRKKKFEDMVQVKSQKLLDHYASCDLENLLPRLAEMEETQGMCRKVRDRLQKLNVDKNDAALRRDVAETRMRFHTFLNKYTQRTPFERLVSTRTIVGLLRDFHVAIDLLETQISGETRNSQQSWVDQWEQDKQEVDTRLIELWTTKAVSILDALPDQQAPENALLLLTRETTANWDAYSAESMELLDAVKQSIIRQSAVSVPVVPGWFIPDYEVQREQCYFASGSFGKVYRGSWRNEKVVIKCVNVVSARGERDFSREARIWGRAKHQNIVKFFGACHLTHPCFFVCEEATKGNLAEFLWSLNGSDRALMWRLLRDAALGLKFLHDNCIIHGDLKCNQILVCEDSAGKKTAKLTDFGLSFVSMESRPATTSGAVRWKAPELLTSEGKAPTCYSDVYSFVEPNIAVVYHLTHGTFLSRPTAFVNDDHWEFVKSLCSFEPSERLGLASVIERMERFILQEQPGAVVAQDTSTPDMPDWFIHPDEVQRDPMPFAGNGSLGMVYRGMHRGEKVIIKCLNVVNEIDEKNFARQAQIWAPIKHSNIVELRGGCHITRPCFFVHEETTHGNLADFLSKNKRSNRALTWRLLRDAAMGLQFLHQKGTIHGDLKCTRILVSQDLTAKLTDIGMSYIEGEFNPVDKGTVRWKAPELLRNEGNCPTVASDLYSFGVCVVEAVSGSVSWQDDQQTIGIDYHLNQRKFTKRPAAFVSNDQWEFVWSMCSVDPTERLGLDAAIRQIEQFVLDES
ncbi:TKL protein kinase [Phytophthora megakarya]|uniref:TKL protein kinase n=1 Tax=Phytophthora megakarya TaxID=4795 RepID=A0A225WFE2_9STRA|nr:TKL protein kinase [Phytophthora megakarya]